MPKDNGGTEPLHFAAYAGSVAVCVILLDAGVSCGVVDNSRRTPLHWAAG